MPTRYDRIPTGIENPHDNNNSVHSQSTTERKIPMEEKNSRRKQKSLKRLGSGSYESIDSDDEDFRNDQAKQSPQYIIQDEDESYPSLGFQFSGSFDLEDDDDDDLLEANLKRYNLDFASTENGATLAKSNDFARGGPSNRCSKAARYIWYSFQSSRQQARERRAQLLLQQTERNWKQSLKICILTNCDETDSGILVVAVTMLLWILVLVLVKNSAFRRIGILLGILCFALRVGTRPLYYFFLRQRQKQRMRKQQLEGQDQQQQHDEDHLHPSHSDGILEMHAIGGDNNYDDGLQAVGSDPTVAAI